MIKNDWVYSLFIGILSIVIPAITFTIMEVLQIRRGDFNSYSIPIFFLSALLPFWIGMSIRVVRSYKRGFVMGLIGSWFAAVLSVFPIGYSFVSQLRAIDYDIIIGIFFITGSVYTISSFFTPFFKRNYWKQDLNTEIKENLLDHKS